MTGDLDSGAGTLYFDCYSDGDALGNRDTTNIYRVDIRGIPPTQAAEIPALSRVATLLIARLLVIAAARRLRVARSRVWARGGS